MKEFWTALLSWSAFVHKAELSTRFMLEDANKHPGMRYESNWYLRGSDGKIFKHHALDGVTADDGEFINTRDHVGSLNSLAVLVDGTTLHRAHPSLDWAWRLGQPETARLKRDLADLRRAQNLVMELFFLREYVERYVLHGILDFQSIIQSMSLWPAGIHLPDCGSMNAALRRIRHFNETGEHITVLY